jgi:hypothetical protein
MSIYVLLSIVTGAVIPPRPLLARRTISSGLSTPSPNAVRILRCSSSASPMAGRCIDSSEEGSSGFRCVEVRTLKNVDGVVVDWDMALGVEDGNKEVSTSSISISSSAPLIASMRGASPPLLVEGFADPSALAALAAAIFCANFESGLEGLASAGNCVVEGVGEEVVGV